MSNTHHDSVQPLSACRTTMKTVKSVALSLMLLASFATIAMSGLTLPVFAGKSSPTGAHFIGNVTFSLGSSLTASGKAAGLGTLPTMAFLSASQVLVNYVCENNGGNVAQGQPLVFQNPTGQMVSIPVNNGQITFTVTLNPPTTPSPALVCPNGNWMVVPTLFTFYNSTVHIQQNGVDVLTFNGGTISGP